MPQTAVSIIVTLYNKENYIERAISSIFNQTFKNFEIIVVDDGSNDNGPTIVESYGDSRLKLIKQVNSGVSVAINNGFTHAEGNLIAFLDADDEWKPSYLETINRLTLQYPDTGLVATTYKMVTSNYRSIFPNSCLDFEFPWEGILSNFFNKALPDMPFIRSSMAVRRDVFEKMNGFQEEIRFGEDIDLAVRIALGFPIAINNEPLVKYYLEDENRAGLKYFYDGNVPFYEKIIQSSKESQFSQTQRDEMLEFLARHQILAASLQLKFGSQETAKEILSTVKYTKKFRNQWLFWQFLTFLPIAMFRSLIRFYIIVKNSFK